MQLVAVVIGAGVRRREEQLLSREVMSRDVVSDLQMHTNFEISENRLKILGTGISLLLLLLLLTTSIDV